MNKDFYIDPTSYDFSAISNSLIHRTFFQLDEICNARELERPSPGSGGKIGNVKGSIEWVHQSDPIENSVITVRSSGGTSPLFISFAGTVGNPVNILVTPRMRKLTEPGGIDDLIAAETKISDIINYEFELLKELETASKTLPDPEDGINE